MLSITMDVTVNTLAFYPQTNALLLCICVCVSTLSNVKLSRKEEVSSAAWVQQEDIWLSLYCTVVKKMYSSRRGGEGGGGI